MTDFAIDHAWVLTSRYGVPATGTKDVLSKAELSAAKSQPQVLHFENSIDNGTSAFLDSKFNPKQIALNNEFMQYCNDHMKNPGLGNKILKKLLPLTERNEA